ncbi:hypothetical protein CCP3SC15_1240008 [Gammaproteobacteria bacterium]
MVNFRGLPYERELLAWLGHNRLQVEILVGVVVVMMCVMILERATQEMTLLERFRWWAWTYRNKMWWFQYVQRPERQTFLYVGLPGSGKTAAGLVYDGIKALQNGAIVAANFTLVDRLTGREAITVGSWLDVLGLAVWALEENEDVLILIDEGHNWADARLWQATTKFAPWLFQLLAQKRHYGIGLSFSTQALGQMDMRIRDLVDGLVECEPLRYVKWAMRGKLPVFRLRLHRPNVEADKLEDDYGVPTKYIWVPLRARFGYSTAQIVGTENFAAYSDEQILETIASLTARAILAATPEPMTTFAQVCEWVDCGEWASLRAQAVAIFGNDDVR